MFSCYLVKRPGRKPPRRHGSKQQKHQQDPRRSRVTGPCHHRLHHSLRALQGDMWQYQGANVLYLGTLVHARAAHGMPGGVAYSHGQEDRRPKSPVVAKAKMWRQLGPPCRPMWRMRRLRLATCLRHLYQRFSPRLTFSGLEK